MKASKGNIGRAVDQPNPQMRFYLFHGPDEAQSRGLGERLREALGATKFVVAAGAAKSDPALLADEAAAMSLFGDKRLVWVEPATKDIEDGVAALLEAPTVECPVVAIAGALSKSSALLKLAEGSPHAMAFAAYAPEGQEAERMVVDLGRRYGLKVPPPVAARLADACGNDQAIVAQELRKLALYVGASPEAPKELDHAAIDEVGAESAEGDFQRLADLALGGNVDELAAQLARLPAGGSEAIPVVRSLQRRLLMLAPARARIERGERIDAVMTSIGRSLFFKDKPKIERMLATWSAERLARISRRAGELERSLMFTPAPDREALSEELITIALQARRR
jgi:DNA polymerase-3 subunit delta